MSSIPRRRVFDAAVLHEGDPGADMCARLVPAHAKLRKAGKAVLGYEASRKRKTSGKLSPADILVSWLRACQDLILHRHWHRPPTVDEARAFAVVVSVAAAGHDREGGDGNTTRLAVEWLRTWCAVLGEDEIERLVTHAVYNEPRLKAARIGNMLKLTPAERTQLGITTIRARGVSDADQKAERREKDKLSKRAKRAAERAANPKPPKPEDGLTPSQRRRKITADRKREADLAGAPRPKRGRPKAANRDAQKAGGTIDIISNKSVNCSEALVPTKKCALKGRSEKPKSPQDLKSQRPARDAAPHSDAAALGAQASDRDAITVAGHLVRTAVTAAVQACDRRIAPRPTPTLQSLVEQVEASLKISERIRLRLEVDQARAHAVVRNVRLAARPRPYSGSAGRGVGGPPA